MSVPAPLFVVTAEGEALRKIMRAATPGELLTYARVREEVGVDLRAQRGLWTTAAEHLLRHERIVFQAVPGEGYRRCTDEEIVGKTTAQLEGLHRQAYRVVKTGQAANVAALAPDARRELETNLTIAAATALETSPTARKLRAANGAPAPLSAAQVRAEYAGLDKKARTACRAGS
jgi:hypothetical protein